jgi:hypothetical protein
VGFFCLTMLRPVTVIETGDAKSSSTGTASGGRVVEKESE